MAYVLKQTGSEVQEALDTVSTNTTTIASLSQALSSKANKNYVDLGLAGKVDKVANKGLSTNDFTDADKSKLDGIPTDAEANVIEAIKVNGVTQTVVNKEVDLTISAEPESITDAEIDALFTE